MIAPDQWDLFLTWLLWCCLDDVEVHRRRYSITSRRLKRWAVRATRKEQ